MFVAKVYFYYCHVIGTHFYKLSFIYDIPLFGLIKSNTIKKIIARFQEYQGLMQFRFTITSLNDKLLKFWEPNAPLFQERVSSLMFAFKNGFRTSVSIEPFLDYNPKNF